MFSKLTFLFRVFVLLFILFAILTTEVKAKTFQDNFDDGNLDGWIVVPDPDRTFCTDTWHIDSGRVGISIDQPSCTTNLIPDDTLWNNLGNNYEIELDMYLINGVDHNVAFRFTPNSPKNDWYDFHFTSPSGVVLERVPAGSSSKSVPYPVPNKPDPYHIKITVESGNIKLFIDNDQVINYEYDPNNDIFPTGKFALRAGTGAVTVSETYFDNIVVTSIDGNPSVPYFSQKDSVWASNTYDNATFWDTTGNPSMANYACALTSAAMVLGSYGHNQLPNGDPLNPGTLNQWLIDTIPNDHEWRIGATPWQDIAGMTNSLSNPPKLEYLRLDTNDFSKVYENLESETPIPDIIQIVEPASVSDSHFLVVTGFEDEDTLKVFDPFDEVVSSLETSTEQLLSIRRFYKTNSNFSYVVAHFDQELKPLLVSPTGEKVGLENGSEKEEVLDSWIAQDFPYFPKQTNTSSGLKSFYEIGIPKAPEGEYQLILTANEPGLYQFEVHFYDIDGQHVASRQSTFVSPANTAEFTFDFSQTPGGNSGEVLRHITFDQLIDDIQYAYEKGMIKHRGLYKSLTTLVKLADLFHPHWERLSNKLLEQAKHVINHSPSRWLTPQGQEFLNSELQLLIDSL